MSSGAGGKGADSNYACKCNRGSPGIVWAAWSFHMYTTNASR